MTFLSSQMSFDYITFRSTIFPYEECNFGMVTVNYHSNRIIIPLHATTSPHILTCHTTNWASLARNKFKEHFGFVNCPADGFPSYTSGRRTPLSPGRLRWTKVKCRCEAVILDWHGHSRELKKIFMHRIVNSFMNDLFTHRKPSHSTSTRFLSTLSASADHTVANDCYMYTNWSHR